MKLLLRSLAALSGLLLVVLLGAGGWYAWATAKEEPVEGFTEVIEYARGYSEFVLSTEPEMWDSTRPEELSGVEGKEDGNYSSSEKFGRVLDYRLTGDQLAVYLDHTWTRVYGGWWQRREAVEDHHFFLERLSVAVERDMMFAESVGEYSWEAFIPPEARESYDCYPNCLEWVRDMADENEYLEDANQ